MGAIEALVKHGADALKQKYLAKLTTGEWMGTMQLTRPHFMSELPLQTNIPGGIDARV